MENDVSRHVSADGPPPAFFVQYDHVKVCLIVILIEASSVPVSSLISLASMLICP
jgi:hypothetical protein